MRRRFPARTDVVLLCLLLAAVFGFYLWTASSSNNAITFQDNAKDRYNLLADAFLDGRASLEVEPPPGLLGLANPYDPVANAQYRDPALVQDLSLYKNRFYLYWGPTPAVTLFIPFRALPFGDMPENLAVVIFSFAGLLFAVALMRFLVRRYLPDTPAWMEMVGVATLGFVNVAPFILRRPSVYEVAISSGYCFFFAGLYYLATGVLRDRLSLWRLLAGSLALGLATGSRYDLGLAAGVVVLVVLYYCRAELLGNGRQGLKLAAAVVGPFVACGLMLVSYNWLRFDSLTEFGLNYQLAGVEMRTRDTFNPSYIPPGLWFYLIAPVRFALAFPYLELPPPPGFPGNLPPRYDGIELTTGALSSAPIILVAVALPFFWRRWARLRELRWIVALMAGIALALAVFLAFTLWGTTMRYEMDFVPLLVLSALLVWYALALQMRESRLRRRSIAVGGVLLATISILVGMTISIFGYDRTFLRTGQPGTYRTLEDVTSPLPTLITMIMGRPVLTQVMHPNGVVAPEPGYVDLELNDASFWMDAQPAALQVVSPGSRHAFLRAVLDTGQDLPRGIRATIVATSSRPGSTSSARVRDGTVAELPLDLRRGLNRVSLKLDFARRSGTATSAPAGKLLVHVGELRLDSAD